MRADFYLIDKPHFREQPLRLVCEFAKKACSALEPTLILCRDYAQAETLDDLLWAFDDDAFIPHQLAGDDDDMEATVLIVPPGIDTLPRPLTINLRDECPREPGQRVLEIVSADPSARDGSRRRWREYQRRNFQTSKHDV